MIAALKLFHMLGLIMWLGGAISLGIFGSMSVGHRESLGSARKVFVRLVRPGLIVGLLAGLALFGLSFESYKTAGWLHGKILFGLLAAGATDAIGAKLRKGAEGQEIAAKTFRVLTGVVLSFVLLNLFLVFFGPQLMS